MNIVIVGAGDVGMYIASTLSAEEHNVILIDKSATRLEQASWNLDVATRVASGADWQLLDELMELNPDVFVAVTENDETNLVACAIAKNLGYPKTIARIRNARYFNRTRLDFARVFDTDYFIGPELLVAHDIVKYIQQPGSLAVESFAHGAVQLRTIRIPTRWRHETKPLAQLALPDDVMVGLIHRPNADGKEKNKVIFPHGSDHILPGDEVTFIGESEAIADIPRFFKATQHTIQTAVLIGGSLTAMNLARLLHPRGVSIRIIEKDPDRCRILSEQLPFCTIIHHDGTDLSFLRAEKVGRADIVIAATESDEVNILAAMLAKEIGAQDTVVLLSSTAYTPIINKLGINYVVSPRVSAANTILSLTLSGRVSSVVSLYDNQAEIVEIKVSMQSRVAGIPLNELGPLLPKDFLICMIQNRGRIMIANGNRIISPGDTVIVISHPRHLRDLEKIF